MRQLNNQEIRHFQDFQTGFLVSVSRAIENFNMQIGSQGFAIGLSLIFVLLFNKSFFLSAWHIQPMDSLSTFSFNVSLIVLLWLSIFFFISLFSIPGVIKPVSIFLFFTGALAAHFMDAYGVVIDREMLRNVWETDLRETEGLINFHLIMYLLVLGILPSVLVLKTKILWGKFSYELGLRIASLIGSLLIAVLLIFNISNYYSSFFRNHKEVRLLANPLGFVNATFSLAHEISQGPLAVEPISQNARFGSAVHNQSKPLLVVFVVGETARAANFALGGYKRNTTPVLAGKDIIYFNNFFSCGTSTALSVPCMFSSLSRANYNNRKAKSLHGLLDFIHTAGMDVLWRDNNSGCKGTCDRVMYESTENFQSGDCKDGICFDEALLHNLSAKITGNNQFIVLHQKGSHGPYYNQQYPRSMQIYKPVCDTNQLHNCSREEIVNAYDNTIRYTDYFLGKVIDWLVTQQDSHNVVMVYVSDHGESLGENNLYLHGMPYAIAPNVQKHVPFIFWASPGFYHDRKLKKECLFNQKSERYSHDNIFHSVLGLLDIETDYYQPNLDIFSPCIKR